MTKVREMAMPARERCGRERATKKQGREPKEHTHNNLEAQPYVVIDISTSRVKRSLLRLSTLCDWIENNAKRTTNPRSSSPAAALARVSFRVLGSEALQILLS